MKGIVVTMTWRKWVIPFREHVTFYDEETARKWVKERTEALEEESADDICTTAKYDPDRYPGLMRNSIFNYE